MATTKTGYWIRVVDGNVTDVWDYEPSGALRTKPGWREAVEIIPDLTENREILNGHSFDLEQTPAQIVWAKRELTVEERKSVLQNKAKSTYRGVVEAEMRKEIDEFPTTQYDAQVVADAQAVYESAMTSIDALTTHDEIDAYQPVKP